MAEHIETELPDYVLGVLGEAERSAVEQHLASCDACEKERRSLERALRGLSEPPPGGVWSQLSPYVEGRKRFEHLAEKVAQMFDLDLAAARALLERIDDTDGWVDGPAERIAVLPVQAGPGAGDALTSIVRIPPGVTLPEHAHHGREEMFVLQGGFREHDGKETWRGESCFKKKGDQHHLVGLEGVDCIAAVTLEVE